MTATKLRRGFEPRLTATQAAVSVHPRRTTLAALLIAAALAFSVGMGITALTLPPHTITRVPASCQTAVNQTAAHLQQLIDVHGSTGITVPLIRQDETALLTHCGVG